MRLETRDQKLWWVTVVLIGLCMEVAFAEKIHFKDGKVIEGKVVKITDYAVEVEFPSGAVVPYAKEAIARIEASPHVETRAKPSEEPPVAQQRESLPSKIQPATGEGEPPAVSKSLSPTSGEYVNTDYGFSIVWPRGWVKIREQNVPGAFVIGYSKYNKPPPTMDLPVFGVTVSPRPPTVKTPLEFDNQVFSKWKSVEAKYEIAEPPHEVEIHGIKAARFMWDKPAYDSLKNREFWVRILNVDLVKGNHIFNMTLFSQREQFESDYGEIQATLESFRFTDTGENEFAGLETLQDVSVEFQPIVLEDYKLLARQVIERMRAKKSFKSLFILKDKIDTKLSSQNYKAMEWLMTFMSPESFEIGQSDFEHGVADIWRVVGNEMYIKIGFWMPQPTQTSNPKINDMFNNRRNIYKTLGFEKYLAMLEKETPVGISPHVQNRYTVIQFKRDSAENLFTGQPEEGSFMTEVAMWIAEDDRTLRFVKTRVEGKDRDGKAVSKEYEHYFGSFNIPFVLGKPETIFHPKEVVELLHKEGFVTLGDPEDRFISDAIRFHVSGPKGWSKRPDVSGPPGSPNLIGYHKFKGQYLPVIGVTKDHADPQNKTPLDFSLKMKEGWIKNGFGVEGPYEVAVGGRTASRMVIRHPPGAPPIDFEWYQFLENGVVITLAYGNFIEEFSRDHEAFQQVVNSFVIESRDGSVVLPSGSSSGQ